jgi:sulfoxide reductase catalytic subunit YedY
LSERLVTPEAVWLDRRKLIGGTAALVAAAMLRPVPAAAFEPVSSLYPAERNAHYTVDRPVTPEEVSTNYNNFYEFGSQKSIAREAAQLRTTPWEIRVEGLVEKPFTISVDELLKKMPLEERVYRHRCVEGWSIVVPWTGFPLSALLALAKPLGATRYVRFESFLDPDMASGQRQFWYPWPYVEGLTVSEAGNDLAFLATGAYGKPLPSAMGAPIRLHCPWKYGFKSVKSISRIVFVTERPVTFWQTVGKDEYGFWANVNPAVNHKRWNQAMERDLGTRDRMPTRLYNGYADFVAPLYAGLSSERLFV